MIDMTQVKPPLYEHDCEDCVFVARTETEDYGEVDVYICSKAESLTAVVRLEPGEEGCLAQRLVWSRLALARQLADIVLL